MLSRILQIINGTFFFFPFRLMIIHFRTYLLLGFVWIFLFLLVGKEIGAGYGIPYLFLDPEYLNNTGYISYSIIGICFGIFFVTWNMITYLLHSYRFPFMASLKWPVAMYTLNNALIPLIFAVYYVRSVYKFQRIEQLREPNDIAFALLGLVAGFILVLLVTSIYFVVTNKDIFGYIKDKKQEIKKEDKQEIWMHLEGDRIADRVDYYLTRKVRIRPVRDVTHYDNALLKRVYRQHHANSFVFILLTIFVLLGLGWFIDQPLFEIPAAGSVFLILSVVVSLIGFLYYWAGSWRTTALLIFLVILNYASGFEFLNYDSQAYGLDYNQEYTAYNLDVLRNISSQENIQKDIQNTEEILNQWKKKNKEGKPYYYKPKLIIVNSNGGGIRAGAFVLKVLQTADSLSNGEFMKHTALMAGASGGTWGLGYFRELYLRELNGLDVNLYGKEHQYNICKDVLNKLCLSIVTNDFFFPWQKKEINGHKYWVDRGMMFELSFNRNTEYVMDKPLGDYYMYEKEATIPMMVVSSVNVSDSRNILMSPQGVSYLMQASSASGDYMKYEIDGVDFGALFKNHDPYNLRFSTALRMNATYPMILPPVSLPSSPKIEVVDAGLRDNYGLGTSLRFINVFQRWIKTHTSGVIVVQIRSAEKETQIEEQETKTFGSKLFRPLGKVYKNLTIMQDYMHEFAIDATNDMLDDEIEFVYFEYKPSDPEKHASMSLRLTEREKEDILSSVENSENQQSFDRLLKLINE